jgi:hypothetical protein
MNRSRPPGREHRLGRQLHHHNVVDVADDLAMLAFDDGADARLARGASTSVVCTLTTTLSFRFGGGTDEIGLSGNSGGKADILKSALWAKFIHSALENATGP